MKNPLWEIELAPRRLSEKKIVASPEKEVPK